MAQVLLDDVIIREIGTGEVRLLDARKQLLLVLSSLYGQADQHMGHGAPLEAIGELGDAAILDHTFLTPETSFPG